MKVPHSLALSWRRRRRDLGIALLLALATALVWAGVYHRLAPGSWRTPIFLGGDGSLVMSFAEAAAEGEFPPVGLKSAHRLGAPFGAEWNSWPITEETLYWTTGVISRLTGLPAAVSVMMMAGHALAAAAFFLACRGLGKPRLPSAVFALLFGLSYFIFLRGLGHISLAYAWHVPLGWLVVCYAFSARGVMKNGRRFGTGIAVAVLTGLQNPYYTFILIQFLGLAALAQLLRPRRSWRTVGGPVLVAGTAVLAFALMQVDTLTDRLVHHRGALSAQRSYLDMELYALKPMDLLLPLHWRTPFFASRGQRYVAQRATSGEFPMAFLGVVGVAGALLLAGMVFRDLAVRRSARLSVATRHYAVPAAWILAVGGVGGVLGLGSLLTGVYFLRGANRFSVVILAILLFFLTDLFARVSRRWPAAGKCALAALLLLAGAVDLPVRRSAAAMDAAMLEQWQSYEGFVDRIEGAAGHGAMIFNLPQSGFPESVPRHLEDPYAPLFLYLARPSAELRFSYGNMAGDFRDAWQQRCALRPAAEMVGELRRLGFNGVLVSRAAYPDRGVALIAGLTAAAGRPVLESPGDEFAFVPLGAAAGASPPAALPATANLSLQAGWWPIEFDELGDPLVWTKGDATLALFLDPARAKDAIEVFPTVSFDVSSQVARTLHLSCRGQPLATLALHPGVECRVESLGLFLQPGWNELQFQTDAPAERRADQKADLREVAVLVRRLRAAGLTVSGEQPTLSVRRTLAAGAFLSARDRAALGGAGLAEVVAGSPGQLLWREFAWTGAPAEGTLHGLADQPVRRIEFLPGNAPFRAVVCLVPGAAPVDHETIVSCITPSDIRGLTLEREAGPEPLYHCALGNGELFEPLGPPVRLSPGKVYLLTLTVTEEEVSLRVQGEEENLDVTLTHQGPECAGLTRAQWLWGNWFVGGRPFAGRIQLVSLGAPSPPDAAPLPTPSTP